MAVLVPPTSSASTVDLLTTDEVMECLLAHDTLRRLAVRCVLPAVRVGDEWRFRRSDLDAWIARELRFSSTPCS